MTISTRYGNLKREEADPIVEIMNMYSADTHPGKIDLSIGVYKSEKGESYVFPSVKQAKSNLQENDPGHNYTTMAGFPDFVKGAQGVVFGKRAKEGKLASLQTISGTGALHMGFLLLQNAGFTDFYVGTPTWGNYFPMIEHVGGKAFSYNHYDESTGEVDFDSVLKALDTASKDSVFLFQACCHNPTGADFTRDQWKRISKIVKEKGIFPFFDLAYQGFSSGDKDEDAWAVRHFYENDIEFVVSQSFAKNMGLYGERVGCFHAVVQDSGYLPNVQSTLVANFRSECSFAPAFGARIASAIMNSTDLNHEWKSDVERMTKRLKNVRQRVFSKLQQLQTPGNWDKVIKQQGLFWYSGLTLKQVDLLMAERHVYCTKTGRINIAGLNDSNVDTFCEAVDFVVRKTLSE